MRVRAGLEPRVLLELDEGQRRRRPHRHRQHDGVLTLLSANLAILNFLPIPALDGGHIMFLTAEAVTGKPVDERLQGTLTLIGVVCLVGLMVFVFANDIGRLFL